QSTEDQVRVIIHKIDVRIQRYIGIKSLVSAIDSILTYFILSYFHVDFAEFWGLMAFFLHFIPYAGSFIALTLPSAIALIQFGDPAVFAMVLGCLCLSHAFLGHVLDPYLMGNNLNLSPIFIISSLAMWGMVWGIPGMFLAVPILAIITIILSQFPNTRPLAILMSKTGVLRDN
ncbi:MAG TPA: AI-2E family transporter, partial [Rhodospirillaceae bacterium]|nr:AI-2E family transporter [Rhodospirillaceae bacterium]